MRGSKGGGQNTRQPSPRPTLQRRPDFNPPVTIHELVALFARGMDEGPSAIKLGGTE